MARPEQTEKPTSKRKAEARAKGQVPKSPDISQAAVFLTLLIVIHLGFGQIAASVATAMRLTFENIHAHEEITIRSVWMMWLAALAPYTMVLLVAFGFAVTIAITANVAQFGFLFAPSLIQPKFSKLNPIAGFKRILFSPHTLVQLFKQLAKLGVVILIVYMQVKDKLNIFIQLADGSPMDIIAVVESTVFSIGAWFGVLVLVLGIIDYAYERKQLTDSLKMTKTEVKDENKQSEGSPEAKGAIKSRQRAAARRRMMAAVPRATVVVTNPTHYAVALEWDEITMEAPVLVAKGADLMAKRIRDLATEHKIPILENPPLARTLYDKVAIDSPIPPALYSAVAQVIAFVYKLKNRVVA